MYRSECEGASRMFLFSKIFCYAYGYGGHPNADEERSYGHHEHHGRYWTLRATRALHAVSELIRRFTRIVYVPVDGALKLES